MQANNKPDQVVFIHRHCMQQLLHTAIACDADHNFGFLAGSGNVVKNSMIVTEKMLSDAAELSEPGVLGVYQCSNHKEKSACGISAQLKEMFVRVQGREPDFYMLIELQHKGRVDVHLFADAELRQPLVLEMQEDSACSSS